MLKAVDKRILILTSIVKDAETSSRLLSNANLCPHICQNFSELLAGISEGAAVLLLAKEVLISPNLDLLIVKLKTQDSWSDLPVVILASAGDLTHANEHTISVQKQISNSTILERPVRVATLISIVESAVANRMRQYEVRDLLQQLIDARKEAEQSKIESDRANQSKSAFLANMSHEIRTPLGVMLGFTDLALDEATSEPDRRKYFQSVHRNGRLLLDLVNDILDLAKVESGHIAVEKIEMPILEILNEIVSGFRTVAAQKNIELRLVVQDEFPTYVKMDPTRFRQIFTNVIGNAVKFTKKGHVATVATFSQSSSGRIKIRLLVSDTGLGISEEQSRKLFQPFSQADSSMAREYGGTGLGLVLSRKLAKILKGDLKLVSSSFGVGSTFEITLEADAVTQIGKRIVNQDKVQPKSIQGMCVLLAEDSIDNQFIISRFLNQSGVRVEIANNGVEAVEKANLANYDVILMDIQMPQLDGNEATRKLRAAGYSKPIVALTANALKGDKEKALATGFDDYITKPIQRNELFNSLSHFNTNP